MRCAQPWATGVILTKPANAVGDAEFPVVDTMRSGTKYELEIDTAIILRFTPGPRMANAEPLDGSLRIRYSFKTTLKTDPVQATAASSQLELLQTYRQCTA